jgi:acetyltransferase-like isoleucine patch superfamily enzyme
MRGYLSSRSKILGRIMEGAVILGASIVGEDTFIDDYVAIGYPSRDKLREKAVTSYDDLDKISEGAIIGRGCIIRRGSIIYENSQLDDGVELGHNVLVRSGCRIGRSSRVGSGAQIDGDVIIGEQVSVQSLAYIPAKSRIGNKVFIGPLVCVTNDLYPPSRRLVGVSIEDEAVIGAASILLPGIRIGKGAVVAAGSIVTEDVDEYSVVMGSPAKPHETRANYETKKRVYETGG